MCCEKYSTAVYRKIVKCNYCNYHSCVTCAQKYLVSQVNDAHCMNCRTGWNREFIDLNMTKTFRTTEWRNHKKNMILNREKATLPAMQKYASAKKQIDILQGELTKKQAEISKMVIQQTVIKTKMESLRVNIIYNDIDMNKENEVVKNLYNLLDESNKYSNDIYILQIEQSKLNGRYNIQYNIYNEITKPKEERREFIMKCVKEGCRGFLSQAYKCELCFTYVCKDCMIPKSEKDDDNHVCKKEDVDTVTMIRKDTRPCPKCGIRISKIDGCDMMWCTAEGCGTPFSWNTGKILDGVIHNPHYYEWVRRNNNGVVPRNPGDNPCGNNQRLQYYELYRAISWHGITQDQIYHISNIHRRIIDIEAVRLPQYPATRDANMFKELHCNFLLNIINETDWRQSMFLKENNFEKKQQIGTILRTLVAVANDTMLKLYREVLDMRTRNCAKAVVQPVILKYIKEFEDVRQYFNDSLVSSGTAMLCAVPQISEKWDWMPIAKVEKILQAREDAKAKLAKATTTTTATTATT